ncbi:MAG: hypothetical protein AABY83_12055 [Pseudomonadota bacterium]
MHNVALKTSSTPSANAWLATLLACMAAACQVQMPSDDIAKPSIASTPPTDTQPQLPTPNVAPEASAGSNFSVDSGSLVTVAGRGTDTDGAVVRYLWEQTRGPSITSLGADREQLQFNAPTTSTLTRISFRFTVTDDKGATGADTVTVTVNPSVAPPPVTPPVVNNSPIVSAGMDLSVVVGSPVNIHATASDPDGNIVSYQWQQLSGTNVTLQGASGADLAFVAPGVTTPEALSFRVTVTDNGGASAVDTLTVIVNTPRACLPDCSANPTVLFTDVVAGPTSGGENNNGAYLNIFGLNFGTAGGLGANTRVYVDNVEVAAYKFLGDAKAQAFGRYGVNVQQIGIQVGALGGLAAGAVGAIKVVVNGASSNTDVTFTHQPGDIIFVSPIGSDATGDGSYDKPYRMIQNSTVFATPRAPNPAWARFGPGDVIVVRGGIWSDAGIDQHFVGIPRQLNGTAPNGKVDNGYLTFQVYPGETATVQLSIANGNHKGGFSGPGSQYYANTHYVVISGFTIEDNDRTPLVSDADRGDGPINSQKSGEYWRVVNNEMSVKIGEKLQKAAGITGAFRYAKIFGNNIHDVEGLTQPTATVNESLINHGMYFDNYVDDLEIAYNSIKNIRGGSGVQFYGNTGSICGWPDCYLRKINMHHNVIDATAKYGLNVAMVTVNGAIYNNTIMNSQQPGLRLASNAFDNMIIAYNSFLNVGIGNGENYGAVHSEVVTSSTNRVYIENNIVYTASTAKHYYVNYNSPGADIGVRLDNNLWFGLANAAVPVPSKDISGVLGDPLFSNINRGSEDLRIGSKSLARGVGRAGAYTPANDFLLRPRTGTLDLGAIAAQ